MPPCPGLVAVGGGGDRTEQLQTPWGQAGSAWIGRAEHATVHCYLLNADEQTLR